MSGGTKKEVDIEQIMQEIRVKTKIDVMREDLENLPEFEDIPIREAGAGQDALPAPGKLEDSLRYVNANYEIPYYWSFGPTGIKTFLKRIVRKLAKCLIPPILEKQNRFNAHVANCLNSIRDLFTRVNAQTEKLNALSARVIAQNEELAALKKLTVELDERVSLLQQDLIQVGEAEKHFRRWQDDCEIKLSAMSRDTIRTKWSLIDHIDEQRDDSEEIIQCRICGYSGIRRDFETKTTKCIFNGGELIRYVCPDCGVIFGPTKFSRQTPEQFDDDYTVHYVGYHEGDSTAKERRAFMLLHPTRTGTYLNYGCGCWSKTMQELRDEGYDVYGYEPYSKDIDNPYIISDKEQLRQMRFNGIFSNDVLEHLADPIADLQFMKSLLATPGSLMSHCTACYNYKYEYTRFHMFFFTGRSVDVICKKTDLFVAQEVDDEPADFICKVFKMQDTVIDILPSMTISDAALREEHTVCIKPGGVVYGPYLTLPSGTYHLEICIQLPEGAASQALRVTAEIGQKQLMQFELVQGQNLITVDLAERYNYVEFVIENQLDGDIMVQKIAIV